MYGYNYYYHVLRMITTLYYYYSHYKRLCRSEQSSRRLRQFSLFCLGPIINITIMMLLLLEFFLIIFFLIFLLSLTKQMVIR